MTRLTEEQQDTISKLTYHSWMFARYAGELEPALRCAATDEELPPDDRRVYRDLYDRLYLTLTDIKAVAELIDRLPAAPAAPDDTDTTE